MGLISTSVFCPREKSLIEKEEEEKARDAAASSRVASAARTEQLGGGSRCAVVSTVPRGGSHFSGGPARDPSSTLPCSWHPPTTTRSWKQAPTRHWSRLSNKLLI